MNEAQTRLDKIASHGARHAVTDVHFPKIDFDQNDHDHFDHHVTRCQARCDATNF